MAFQLLVVYLLHRACIVQYYLQMHMITGQMLSCASCTSVIFVIDVYCIIPEAVQDLTSKNLLVKLSFSVYYLAFSLNCRAWRCENAVGFCFCFCFCCLYVCFPLFCFLSLFDFVWFVCF